MIDHLSMEAYFFVNDVGTSRNHILDVTLMTTRLQHASVVQNDHCILTIGGCNQQDGNLRSTEIYNPNSGEVFQGPKLLTGRRLFSTARIGRDIYIAGGVSSVNHQEMSISSCEMLSEGHLNWCPIGQMRNARSAFGMAAAGGNLYAFGGVDHDNCPLSSVEYYSPEHKMWSFCESMVFSRTHHAVAKLNNWIYVCGGKYGHCRWDLVTCDRFNWVTGEWEEIASMNYGRSGFVLIAVPNGLYAAGGWEETAKQSVEMYIESRDEWIILESRLKQIRGFGSGVFI